MADDDDVKLVCLCGCPDDEHENLGEDGMSCGNDHFCIPVWPSVRDAYVDAERRFDEANRALGAQMIQNSELRARVAALPPFGTWRGECGHLWNREKGDASDAECPTCLVMTALEQSVSLQSHYAELLNMHDGGERMLFANAAAWLARLAELKART